VRWISSLLSAVLLIFSGVVWGQECTVTTTPVNFGQYVSNDPSPVNAVGNVRVACSTGTAFTVKLDPGENSGGNFHPRKLVSVLSGGVLDYNLYRDPTRTEVLGDGTSNTYFQAGIGTGGETILNIYGRIAGNQDARGGTYRDAINVTVEW